MAQAAAGRWALSEHGLDSGEFSGRGNSDRRRCDQHDGPSRNSFLRARRGRLSGVRLARRGFGSRRLWWADAGRGSAASQLDVLTHRFRLNKEFKVRIAVWHNLPSGGAKRALYDHVRGLIERGHHVEAWSPPTIDRNYLPLESLVPQHVVPLADAPY